MKTVATTELRPGTVVRESDCDRTVARIDDVCQLGWLRVVLRGPSGQTVRRTATPNTPWTVVAQ